MEDLEQRLIRMCQKDDFDLAEAAFIASGVRDKGELIHYMARFENLCIKISEEPAVKSAQNYVDKAKAIFDWLWESRPWRYREDDYGVRLTHVLDSQLSSNRSETIGDCVGLTVLYNAICQRLGIPMKAYEYIGHICSALAEEEYRIIPVENTFRSGFDSHLKPGRLLNNQKLIQKYLRRIAGDYEESGRHREAFAHRMIDLKIKPTTTSLFYLLDKGEETGNLDLAVESYRELLECYPLSSKITMWLGNALETRNKMGDVQEAIFHYKEVLASNPNDTRILSSLARAYIRLGDKDEALSALERAVCLNPGNPYYDQLIMDYLILSRGMRI